MQKLRHDQARHAVMDRTVDENDPLLEQPRENIVGSFAPAGLFHDHRHEGIHVYVVRVFHPVPPAVAARACAAGQVVSPIMADDELTES
jgi:hypothetical protein